MILINIFELLEMNRCNEKKIQIIHLNQMNFSYNLASRRHNSPFSSDVIRARGDLLIRPKFSYNFETIVSKKINRWLIIHSISSSVNSDSQTKLNVESNVDPKQCSGLELYQLYWRTRSW